MKKHEHICTRTLTDYLEGEIEPEKLVQQLVLELGRCCPTCQARVRRWKRRRPRGLPGGTRQRVEAMLSKIRAAEPPACSRDALSLIDSLLRVNPAERMARVQADRHRHRSRLLVQAALARVEECFPASPEDALDRMDLAHALVMLFQGTNPEDAQFQRNAAAWVYALRSCAYRVRGSLALAEYWMARARTFSVTAPRVSALLDEHEGALRLYQNRLPEACDLLARSIAKHRRRRAREEAARATVLLAMTYREAGRLEDSVSATIAAARDLHPRDNQYVYFACQFLRGMVLCELGDPEAAADLLEQNSFLCVPECKHPTPLRFRWLEGLIAFGRGDHAAAVSALEQARRLALENGSIYDAALISLDLALVHLDRFDWEALRREAEAILPIVASEELPRETAAALALHREALHRGRLEREALHRLAHHIRGAQWGRA